VEPMNAQNERENRVALVPTISTLDVGGSFRMTATGLVQIRDHVTFEELQQLGEVLGRIEVGLQWARGDWWALTEHVYGARVWALNATGGERMQTWANWGAVSRRIERSRRREDLSWSHHEVVAALPDPAEQDMLLDAAIIGGWSVRELRRQVKSRHEVGDPVLPFFGATPEHPTRRDDVQEPPEDRVSPRIHRDLRAAGVRVSRKRVARVLKQAGLQGVSRCKWPVTTVRAEHTRPPAAQTGRAGSARASSPSRRRPH
jgi:hypothetical protein